MIDLYNFWTEIVFIYLYYNMFMYYGSIKQLTKSFKTKYLSN